MSLHELSGEDRWVGEREGATESSQQGDLLWWPVSYLNASSEEGSSNGLAKTLEEG